MTLTRVTLSFEVDTSRATDLQEQIKALVQASGGRVIAGETSSQEFSPLLRKLGIKDELNFELTAKGITGISRLERYTEAQLLEILSGNTRERYSKLRRIILALASDNQKLSRVEVETSDLVEQLDISDAAYLKIKPHYNSLSSIAAADLQDLLRAVPTAEQDLKTVLEGKGLVWPALNLDRPLRDLSLLRPDLVDDLRPTEALSLTLGHLTKISLEAWLHERGYEGDATQAVADIARTLAEKYDYTLPPS